LGKETKEIMKLSRCSARAIIFVLVLAAAAFAAAQAPANRKSKRPRPAPTAACPNATACGLVTQQAYDELAGDVDFLEKFITSVSGRVKATVTIEPDNEACSVDQAEARDFFVDCFQETSLDPPDIYLTSSCPAGYTAAIEVLCSGEVVDAQNSVIGRLALLESGSFSATGYCVLSTAGLLPGQRVVVNHLIVCSYFEGMGGARAARLGSRSQATIAAQFKAERMSRRRSGSNNGRRRLMSPALSLSTKDSG
jgi:hypothetical protein